MQDIVPDNPPAFNVPGIIVGLGAILVSIHAIMSWASDALYRDILLTFSFIPISYTISADQLVTAGSRFWSPLTYAFLHGDWVHLLVNSIWLLAFGSAVARRFGALRFAALFVFGAIAGAAFHYLFHPVGNVPVVGASAAVSACMGAAVRFAFRPGGVAPDVETAPAFSLLESLKNRNIMTFVVMWFAINWLFGTGWLTPGEAGIAWEAHMGGFLLGWLGFSAFDRRSSS
ncbi:MAG: rhomboid family intramembrane serine protease [Ahrensia sp.]|nr:rhomboid family intramembrane serine protease [Ahrensia sp.]